MNPDSKDTSGGVSLSLGKTLSVHGEWATHKRRTYVPTRQTAQFMRFGTPGHPVDELVIYGSQLKGVMGTGTIRKVILVDKADTHAQDGASWNASVSLKDLGKTGWDAVSSVGAGVKGGDSSKVVDGKAEFKCDGVEILEPIERITAETYDRRYGVNLTKHFTSTGDAAGAAAAYAPAYSGRLELGEDSVGFELPNVMFHEKTETTSQQIARRDAEQAALEAQRQREAAQRAADAAEELQRNALKAICDQFEAENPTLVKDLIAKKAAEAEAQRAAEAQRQRDLAAQRAAAAAKDTELQKEKINEALVNILTPGQLAQNVADAEYKKTSAYQIEQELQHIKARTQEMQKMSAAEKNTPEWRKEFMDLHQASERLGVFDPEWRERQATAGAAGMVGTLAVLAPQFTYRMMLGHLAGKAMTEGLLQNAHSEEDVAMAHLVGLATDLAVGTHMPTGGVIARGVPLTTAAAATAESGGLLNRLRAAGQEFGQWRPDPHAMGTPLEIATAGEARTAAAPVAEAASTAPVAEAAVNGAPLSIKREPVKVVTATGDKITQMHVTGVEGCQSHHIISWTNRHTKNHPLVKAAGYDLEHDMGNRILLPDGTAAELSTTYRTVHQGKHVDTYSEALAIRMGEIHTQGMREGWNQPQYRAKLEALISETRQQLKSGEIQLNKTTRESLGLPTKPGAE